MTHIGPYDRLYASRELLWPSSPGRMVRKACELRPPGNALDVGCGDGKNILYMLKLGWSIDAFDVSQLAIDACRKRLWSSTNKNFRLWTGDCRSTAGSLNKYDIVVAYGLYHCLDDQGVQDTHRHIVRSLKPKGLFVYAAFNDVLPLPEDHPTDNLVLRHADHIKELMPSFKLIDMELGTIQEEHLPLIGEHSHSLTWAIYEKPE